MEQDITIIFEDACAKIGRASAAHGRISEDALTRIGLASKKFVSQHECLFSEMSTTVDAKLKSGMRRTNVDPV